MLSLPRYYPLAQTLHFAATVHITTRLGNTAKKTQLQFPLTLEPAPEQGWGPYCLAITRGAPERTSYAPNAADEVVALLAQPLRYLEITFDADGSPLKLRNHESIWQMWKTRTAPAIAHAHTGSWVEKLLAQTERDLLHADALLQTLLQNDWLLHPYFSVLEWLAGGTDEPAPIGFGGKPLQLQNQCHFSLLPGGAQALKLTAAGTVPKGQVHAQLPLQKEENEPELNVKKSFSYTFPEHSLWSSGFSGSYCFDGGAAFEKNIYLQLSPL